MKSLLLIGAILVTSFFSFSQSGATFKFVEETHDFGTIKQGEVMDYEFTFTNTGNEPLIISNCSASCGCTTPEWSHNPIVPGGKGLIKVKFNSQGKMGPTLKQIYITSNATNVPAGKQSYEIYIKCNILPPNTTPNSTPIVPVKH